MGAGRSGTTALATFLGNAPDIITLGEMHPFFEYLLNEIPCSCGKTFYECDTWRKIVRNLPDSVLNNLEETVTLVKAVEGHRNIFQHLARGKHFDDADRYLPIMENLLRQCQDVHNGAAVLDSAKYISRALALRHLDNQDLKVIYMVRDVRGIVYSFAKKVQTTRGTISALLYYLAVNIAAEFVRQTVLRRKVLKIRYEDMLEKPGETFSKLEQFLEIDLSEIKKKIDQDQHFTIAHLVGGNRLREDGAIYFRSDIKWRSSYSIAKQIIIYLGALPLMLLNKYPLFVKEKRE